MAAEGVIVAPTLLAQADLALGRLRPFHPEVEISGAEYAPLVPMSSTVADVVATFTALLRRRIAETEAALASPANPARTPAAGRAAAL